MAVKRLVSDKHPITVRISEEDYKKLAHIAVENNESVNQMILRLALESVKDKK